MLSFNYKFLLFLSFSFIILGLSLIVVRTQFPQQNLISPLSGKIIPTGKPFDHYSIENLKKENIPAGKIITGKNISGNPDFSTNLFFLNLQDSSVSGLMNIPKIKKPLRIIILLRGYVDRDIYQSGTGTKRIGEFLAKNGFITIAPDFLGYGNSSKPKVLPLEERFQTYTTVLALIKSIPVSFPSSNIGLFGHSNGGHIALAALEISGISIPTVLWAPVSKPFPYSILAYTDEFEDKGKALRKLIADFEKDYDITKYSIDGYFDWITAPLEIHQGLADEEVPFWWSDELVQILTEKNKEVTYFKYPGQDHNFNGGSWETLAARTLNFYRQHLK